MIEGALWRKWVFYYIPLILFVFVLLFPFYWMIITTFRPDGELYRPWNAVNYMPFWTNKPTLEHITYLFEETELRALDVQHDVHRRGLDPDLAVLRRAGGLRAGAAQLPVRRQPGHRDLRHLPGAADAAVHPAGRDHPQLPSSATRRGR